MEPLWPDSAASSVSYRLLLSTPSGGAKLSVRTPARAALGGALARIRFSRGPKLLGKSGRALRRACTFSATDVGVRPLGSLTATMTILRVSLAGK